MEMKSLAHISPDQLYKAFNEAFSDYARSWPRQEFDSMLTRRGYIPEGYRCKETFPDPILRSAFWDFDPSWQNNSEAIERRLSSFKPTGIFYEHTLAACSIIEPRSDDVPQLPCIRSRRTGMTNFLNACNVPLSGR